MARHKDAVPAAQAELRLFMLDRLKVERGLLDRRGNLGTRFGLWLWTRVRRFERIDALERGESVLVQGVEVAPALTPFDRSRLDLHSFYRLDPDGFLSKETP